jgi:S-adenosylmethionine:tRNA ribosyltransferase-isomerase
MKKSDFNYHLPEELIAKYPVENRTDSRLLILEKESGKITHAQFKDIQHYIQPTDLLVLNNTKVIPARLYGEKETGGKLEILVEKILSSSQALVHCKASKRPKINQDLLFPYQLHAKVLNDQHGLLLLQFNRPILEYLTLYGHIPLPPYLNRQDESLDKERYQTVYAKLEGSVAAPTAGLHFDESLLRLFNTAYITLHVGAGTFQSLRVENIRDHIMHAEYAELSQESCDKIKHIKSDHGKIIAVGTTTVRTLESASIKTGDVNSFLGETNLFITPGFEFKCVDAMITNFHLPESTLLMLVCAFAGVENVMKAYQIAVENRYRFFSYGDAMLII